MEESLEQLDEVPYNSLPHPFSLRRAVNRCRAKLRPRNPQDLYFAFDRNFVDPAFLLSDLQGEGFRHLVFATEQQLDALRQADTWFIDATFSIVRDPFYQLFSIHSVTETGGEAVLFPRVFCVMSRRRRADYESVLR